MDDDGLPPNCMIGGYFKVLHILVGDFSGDVR